MFSDLLADFGVEKIRKDFGDFAATIFNIIINCGGCFLEDLNFLIPKIDYAIIRFSILILFRHNIIFLTPIFDKKLESIQKKIKIKILPRLHECIYRIRYPRFISLMEHEYGLTGRKITELFYEKGQVFLENNFFNLFSKKEEKFKIENILIQMARDGFIESVFFYFDNKKNNFNQKNFLKKNKKPLSGRKNATWKLSSHKLNFTLKINLILATVGQYYGEKIFFLLRSCFSRIINFKVFRFFNCWFSLDSLVDNAIEILKSQNFNEINITEIFDGGVMDRCFLRIKNSRLKISVKFFFEIIRNKIFENLIGNQFGKNFLRIFKILAKDLESEEKQISIQSWLEVKIIRKELFKMYKLGLVTFEEKNCSFFQSTTKKSLIWKINFLSLKKRFISEILKSIYNLLLKLENLQLFFLKISFFFKDQPKNLKNYFQHQRVGLTTSILRLDEILLIIYS
mmetsp:Transcript_26778/g.62009  ORF Transcript_26778/g.62009 Transcript_26778/m.62009 type:complete len:455 (+) Transcript_26778:95-1459(+)